MARNWHGTTNGTDRVHRFDQRRHLSCLQYRAADLPGFIEAAALSRLMPVSGEVGARRYEPRSRVWLECAVLLAARQDKLSDGDKRDAQRIPPGGTPGYGVLILRAGWRLTGHFTVAAALENVWDKDYRVHGPGLNEPGRNLILTAPARF